MSGATNNKIVALEEGMKKLEILINSIVPIVERLNELQQKKGGRPRNIDKYGEE